MRYTKPDAAVVELELAAVIMTSNDLPIFCMDDDSQAEAAKVDLYANN